MTELIAQNLTKKYKQKWIVNNITIQIKSGEIVGLLGSNGAGKTTIFYIIGGIIQSYYGVITLDKINISRLPLYSRVKLGIGYLSQEPSIFRQMSVFDNIMSVLEINKKLNRKECKIQTEELLNKFNINHLKNNVGNALSGGERRKVEIARTLASNPKIILLDEPFAAIDPIAIAEIKEIIKTLRNNGLGILITDHNAREILNICNKIYFLHKGTLITSGSPLEITNNKEVKKIYLGSEFNM